MKTTETSKPMHILHVDDDSALLEVAKQILQVTGGFEIDTAQSVQEAQAKIQSGNYDAIVSDYEMPQKNGLQFLKELKENNNPTPFILFTGRGREEVAIAALNLGADGYINKFGQPETVYGELTHAIQLVVDRNKAKQALQESEQRYHALIEQASIAMIVHDLKGNIIDANQQACKNLQYTKEELTKMTITDIDPGAAQEEHEDRWEKVLHGQNFTFITKQKRKDQTILQVEVTIGPIEIDKITLVMGLIRDISERQKNQEELQKSEEKYRQIVELSPDGIITATMTGTITSINKAFTELTGYTKEEIIGKHFTKIGTLKLTDVPSYLKVFGSLIAGKVPRKIEFPYITKDKTQRVGEARFNIMKENGKKIGLQAILRDITEKKDAEANIRKTSQELMAESAKLRLLNEKLQDMSKLTKHDLNNKLATIQTSSYMLSKTKNLNQETRTYLTQIDNALKAAQHILKLSENYANIGAQNPTQTNIQQTFNKATQQFTELKNIKIENQTQNLTVKADIQLEQLFYNLIDNSLRHGQKVTHISLTYKKEGEKTIITYQDNGIGVPETDKQKIFDEGYSTANSTGYGLHLSKKIAQGYGWAITENGTPNQGAKFSLTIPNN